VQSKYLAHTAAVLEQASEDLLGFGAAQANKSIMTKLPARLFCDFSHNGSLAIILCCALRYKNEQGWKADDFKERLLKDTTQAVSLFLKIEKDLLHAQLLKRPKVFFSPMLPKEVVSELKIVVQRHNGTVVLRADQATHEIIADVSQEEEDGDYCRTIDEQDNKALVHWWYYPDSYREWKPQSEIQGKPEPAMPTPVLWKVQARFIRDLEKFNEWMNEEDYLATDDDDDDDDGAERVDGEGVQEAGSKRRRAEDDDGGETRGRGRGRGRGKGRGRGRGRGRRSFEVGGDRSELESRRAAEEQLYDTPKPLPAFRAAPESLGKGLQTGLPRAMVSLEAFAAQARALTTLAGKGVVAAKERAPEASPPGVILVPSYASWYKMSEIAPQERKAMAEWFTGTCTSKTPQSYVEARDLIVKLYRENPTRHLTATECRRHLAIDVCAVLRLHAFLQHWGLINYNLSTAQRPVVRGPMDSTGLPVLIAMPNGTLVPKDVLSAGGFGVPDGTSTSATSAVSKNFVPASHAATQANIFHTGATDEAEAQVPSEQIRCTVTGQVCTAERYHCIQKPELVISPAAFASEQWPPGYSAIDFVRVCAGSVEPHAVVSDWTDTEVLRLLEALEQYGEDWTRVAAYVSSKTKEQCILQFLRLPIEDRYLDEQVTCIIPLPSFHFYFSFSLSSRHLLSSISLKI
jgi:SWI/SNF related-matrix-associated actin-dependent regulator of chromatin subfamily C